MGLITIISGVMLRQLRNRQAGDVTLFLGFGCHAIQPVVVAGHLFNLLGMQMIRHCAITSNTVEVYICCHFNETPFYLAGYVRESTHEECDIVVNLENHMTRQQINNITLDAKSMPGTLEIQLPTERNLQSLFGLTYQNYDSNI